MKNKIRKWLGINQLEESVSKIHQPTQTELRKMIGDAFVAALENKGDEAYSYWGRPLSIKNTLITALENASLESSSKQAKWEVQNIIGSEAFIDKVVERIKRKQLSD